MTEVVANLTVITAAGEFLSNFRYDVDLDDPRIKGLVLGGYLSVVPKEVSDDSGDNGRSGTVSPDSGREGSLTPEATRRRRPKAARVTSEQGSTGSSPDTENVAGSGTSPGDTPS